MKKIIFILILSINYLYAQNIDTIKPVSYRDKNNNLYWNKKLPVYIHISSSPTEKGETLDATNKAYSNPYYFANEGKNSFLIQGVKDNKTNAIYKKLYAQFPVIVDGSNPVTKHFFSNAPSGRNSKGKYYGVGLKISLTARDKYSGIRQIFYSINQKPFTKYTDTLTNFKDGHYSLQFYSIDNVGNKEKTKEIKFTVDTKAPVTIHRIVGEYIPNLETLSERSKIELLPKDSSAEIKYTKYQIDKLPVKIYAGKAIPVRYLSNGYHIIKYFSVDKVNNIEDTVSYKFYVDKASPILTSDVLGDRYVVNDQVYFSGRTKFKLICMDNKSGIDSLKYSIDKKPFKDYKEAFYLPRVPGYHYVSYYAKDKFGNTTRADSWENTKYQTYGYNVEKIYIDLVGPTIGAKFTGFYYFVNDTVLLGKDAGIILYGKDSESGLQYISWALDGEKEETKYTKEIKISTHGKHTLEYFGYDNVNNRNIGKLVFYADFNPPEINYYYSVENIGMENGIEKFPSNMKLYLAATDVQVGVKKIEYKLNNGIKSIYSKAIYGFNKGKVNELIIYATDNLNNVSEKKIQFYIEKR